MTESLHITELHNTIIRKNKLPEKGVSYHESATESREVPLFGNLLWGKSVKKVLAIMDFP